MFTLSSAPRLLLVLLVALWQPLCLCQAGHAAGHHHGSEQGTEHSADHEHSAAGGHGEDEAGGHDHELPGDHGDGHRCDCDGPVFVGADKDPLLKKSTHGIIALENRAFATGHELIPAGIVLRPPAADWWPPPRPLSILYCSFLI